MQQDHAAGGLGVQEVAERAEHDRSLVGRRPAVALRRHRRVLADGRHDDAVVRGVRLDEPQGAVGLGLEVGDHRPAQREVAQRHRRASPSPCPASRPRWRRPRRRRAPCRGPAADVASRAASSRLKRLRSAWDSSTLSYSGRMRIGAGTSGSGSSPSGTSRSSRPRSSRNVRRPRPQPFDDLAEPGQPGPRRHVGGGRRAEGGEVAEHDVVDRRPLDQRTAEPRLGGGRRHLAALSPQAPGRHLDEGQPVAAGERQRAGILVRVPLGDQPAQLADAARALLEERAERGDDGRARRRRPAWAGTRGAGPSRRRGPVGRAAAAAARRRR